VSGSLIARDPNGRDDWDIFVTIRTGASHEASNLIPLSAASL
jgi:hypothetical protein